MAIYNGELREIRRKSRQVYRKHGIRPFLTDSVPGKESYFDGDIPGFQIFRLFDFDDIICDDSIKDD